MRKLFAFVLMLLFTVPAFAQTVNTYDLNGYLVSVEEKANIITVHARSKSPYGVHLFFSKRHITYESGENTEYLEADFGVVGNNIKSGTPVPVPSDVYGIKTEKSGRTKIILTIKTGSFINAQQVIWQKPPKR